MIEITKAAGFHNSRIFVVDSGKGFNFPYILVVPNDTAPNAKMILESCNLETSNQDAIINNSVGHLKRYDSIANVTGAPYIMPILPSPEKDAPYFQQLSHSCFDKSQISKYPELENIDEQVCNIIKDAQQKVLNVTNNVIPNDKVVLNGYSSSGVFAQRFAFLHPEIVDKAIIGGAIGTIPLPPSMEGSKELNYPLGTKNYEQLTGHKFNEEAYKQIKFNYYTAEFEGLVDYAKRNVFGKEFVLPMHDMALFDRSTENIDGVEYSDKFGVDLLERYKNVLLQYEQNGYDISSRVYKGKEHKNSVIANDSFVRLYFDVKFEETSKDVNPERAKLNFEYSKKTNTNTVSNVEGKVL